MADQVIITDINPKAVVAAGWAQEVTLVKLASSGKASAELLKQLAQITANGDKKLLDEIDQASQATVDGIRKASDSGASALGGLFEEQEQSTKASLAGLGAVFKSSIAGLSKATSAEGLFAGLGQSLKSAGTYMSGLGPATKILSLGLGSLIIESGVLYEKIVKLTKATESLYATGLVFQGGMKGLTDSASAAGLTVETFSKMLTKFGAAAGTLGVDRLAKVNAMFLEQTNMGADLMMNQEEASEAFFESAELLRSSGKLASMSNADIVKSGTSLLKTYNELAEATGRNRDEIRKNTAEMLKMPDVNALARLMPDPEKFGQTMAGLAAEFGDGGKEMASMVAQMKLAGGSMGTLPGDMAAIVNQVPGLQRAMIEAGNGDPEAIKRMRDAIGNMDKQRVANLMIQFPEAGKQLNAWMQQTQQATEIERRRSNMTVEELENEKRSKAEAARALAVQNRVSASFARFGNAFDKLAVSLENVLLPVVDALAVVLETLAGWVNKITSYMPESGLGQAAVLAIVPTVLSALYSGKGIIGLLKIGKRLLSAEGLAEVGSKLGDLVKPGKLGALAKSLLGGVADKVGKVAGGAKNVVTGGASKIGGMLSGIGSAISGLPKFAGDLLKGIAEGIAAFGSTKVLLGAAALAILAADFWLFTKALQGLNTVEWSSILKAGIIITAFTLGVEPFAIAIDAASATLAAATPAILLASVDLAIFGASLIPIAFALNLAAPAFEAFGNVIAKSMQGVSVIITSIGDSIATVFNAIGNVDFGKLAVAGLAIGGLAASLTAAAVAAPAIWVGSKVMGNAIERIGEGIGAAISTAGPQAFDLLISSINKLATIRGDALIKTATGLMAIGDVFNSGFFGSKLDVGKVLDFVDIFSILGAYRREIQDGSAALDSFARVHLSKATVQGLQTLVEMFESHWFSKDLGDINPDYVDQFINVFALLGPGKSHIEAGSAALKAFARIDLKPESVKGLETLAGMFSSHWFKKDLGDVNQELIKTFIKMFADLGQGQSAIISGAGSLAAFGTINLSEEKVKGVKSLSEMFSSNWFSKDIGDVKPELIKGFIKMFADLGAGQAAIIAGSDALLYLGQVDLSEEKVKGIKSLSEMFSSKWFSKDLGDIKPELIQTFIKMFADLGQGQSAIISGAGSLAAFGTINLSEEKVNGVKSLIGMFSSNIFSKDLSNVKTGLIVKFIDMFATLGAGQQSIIDGSDALMYIGQVDLSEDKINGLSSLAGMFTNGGWFGKDLSSIDPKMINKFTDMFAEIGKGTSSIITGAGALAALSTITFTSEKAKGLSGIIDVFSKDIDPGKSIKSIDGFMSILDHFGSKTDLITKGVDAINSLNNIDPGSLNTIRDLAAAIYGGDGAGSAPSATSAPTTPTITSNLDNAATDYYASTSRQFDTMIELLKIANFNSLKLLKINEDGFGDTVSAVNRSSGTVY